jgi:D-tyrosyl-tRNA(Tyr) deacylase
MRVLVQRVASARVEVEGQVSGAIGAGMLLLVGVEDADGEADIAWLSAKLSKLRIFPDAAGVMNRSLIETGGEVLAVSQFTLFASLRKGNRPAWSRAAGAEISRPLFDRFVRQLEHDLARKVETGVFGADMKIHLVNDEPVTIAIDSRNPE